MSNEIEALYREKMNSLGPKGRIMRLVSLFNSTQNMLKARIKKQNPHLSEKEVRKEMAKIMYRADKDLLALIPE